MMLSVFSVLAISLGFSLAAQSPTPPLPDSGPICFTPPDRHPSSSSINVCTSLLSKFVKEYTPPGSIMHWTSNQHEVGPNVVHLPKIEYQVNHNRTHACLIEVIDETGVGDSFPASEVQIYGQTVLSKCFSQNKCGIIALPPTYTIALAVCGSYHRGNGSEIECVLPVDEDRSISKKRRGLDVNGMAIP